jgi:hypothetical protein
VVLPSPYRRLFAPLLRYVDDLRKEREEMIAVLLPDLVEGGGGSTCCTPTARTSSARCSSATATSASS